MLTVQVVGSKFPPEYAGAGFRILSTYRRLIGLGAGLRWSVITGSTEFPGHAHYVHDGVEVERISSPLFVRLRSTDTVGERLAHALRSWIEAARLWRRLATRRFDLLHIFGNSSVTTAALIYATVTRRRIVIELVTTRTSAILSLPGLRIAPFLRRRIARQALIIAISQALAERCAADGFRQNVWMRPNPVDTGRYFPDYANRMAFRAQYTSFSSNDIVLGMVAKFMPQKNQIFLIDVLAKLPERFKLVLAGPLVIQGPLAARDLAYIEALRNRVTDLGLSRRVQIVTEFVPADHYIKLSDVYLLPNRNEGLATPMLESLACGIPVVGNAGEAAFTQWINDGNNGFLRPLDASAWAQAIVQAAEFVPTAMQEAAAAIADVASAEKIDRRFLGLIQTLTSLPSGTPIDVAATLKDRS